MFYFIVLLLITCELCYCKDIGESCVIEHLNKAGTCKLFTKCQSAKNDLLFKRIRPTSCGYDGYIQIVCCEDVSMSNRGSHNERISREKCKEYSKTTTTKVTAILLLLSVMTDIRESEVKSCGHNKIPLIVGGTEASGKEFPHSALLGIRNRNVLEWVCGGSLISPRFVLTAAHCSNEEPIIRVRLGELNLSSDNDDAKPIDFDVQEVINHPRYTPQNKYNDIALVKLTRDAQLNEFIKPICLPEGNENYQRAIATGWGRVKYAGKNSKTLLKVTLDIFDHNECSSKFLPFGATRELPEGILNNSQICAGSYNESRDTCQGDSGGPLQIYHSDIFCSYTQIGVTSFGKVCGTVNFPGIYTRVSEYIDWIEGIVWPDDDSP